MKRKFLEELGLEKETIDKIMAENGADIEAAKADQENLKSQVKGLEQQVQERDTQLEELKKNVGDHETLKQQIIDLQAENQAAKEKYDADTKELKLSAAIKLAVGDSAHDAELVSGLFDRSKLVLSDDGKVAGLEEQLKTIKKEKAFLFKEQKPAFTIKGSKPAESGGTPPATKEPMTYSEMVKYLEENPGAKI